MSDFLGKLKSGIEKLASTSEMTDTAIKNDTIPKDSVFSKEKIDFKNADTITKQSKSAEESIEEDIINLFSEKSTTTAQNHNPNVIDIKDKFLKETGREFSVYELMSFSTMDDEKIEIAKKIIKEDKDKIYSGDEIALITRSVTEQNFEKIKKLMNMKERDFAFEALEIVKLSKLKDSEIETARQLSSIKEREHVFTGKELFLLAQIPEADLEKYISMNPKFAVQKLTGTSIALEETSEIPNKRIFNVYDTSTKQWVEKRTEEQQDNTRTDIIENKQNNIKQILKTDINNVIQEETVYRYDKQGNLISTERLKNSTGMLTQNVSKTDTNGKQTPVQWAEKNETTGNTTIQKNFVSYDGTKTDYFYEETPDGMKISDYKITDKNGKVLLDEHTTFSPVKDSKNKFLSSVNGKVYEIEHNTDRIIVKDNSTGEIAELDTDKLTKGKPENIIQVLKETPGNYLMIMAKNPITIENTTFDSGAWDYYDKNLILGTPDLFQNNEEQFSVFMHEVGHFIDTEKEGTYIGIISENPELTQIYKEELSNFKKNSTIKQQEFIDYFIGEDETNGKAETMAETNMLLTTPYSSRRSLYLQQHFPKTIAKIAELRHSVLSSNH